MLAFVRKVINKLFSYFGRESASYILFLQDRPSGFASLCDDFDFTSIDAEIRKLIGSLRIENKHYRNWTESGGLLCFAKLESPCGAPRGWLHFAGVRHVSSFACHIGKDAAWLGPDYTPQQFRGRRLHAAIIQQRVVKAFDRENVELLATAVNVKNVASLRNYLRCGFKIGGVLRSRRFLFFVLKNKEIYSDVVSNGLKIK